MTTDMKTYYDNFITLAELRKEAYGRLGWYPKNMFLPEKLKSLYPRSTKDTQDSVPTSTIGGENGKSKPSHAAPKGQKQGHVTSNGHSKSHSKQTPSSHKPPAQKSRGKTIEQTAVTKSAHRSDGKTMVHNGHSQSAQKSHAKQKPFIKKSFKPNKMSSDSSSSSSGSSSEDSSDEDDIIDV